MRLKKVNKHETGIKKLKQNSKEHNQKIRKLEATVNQIQDKDMELSIIRLEMDKSQYMIRIQNFPEQQNENEMQRVQT